MPCNLAVSITKAAAANEDLQALLTPPVVAGVVTSFLQRKAGATSTPQMQQQNTVVTIAFAGYAIRIEQGIVTVSSRQHSDAQVKKMTDELTVLLAQLADTLFAKKVGEALKGLGQMTAQTVNVDDRDKTQQATVFTLNI